LGILAMRLFILFFLVVPLLFGLVLLFVVHVLRRRKATPLRREPKLMPLSCIQAAGFGRMVEEEEHEFDRIFLERSRLKF